MTQTEPVSRFCKKEHIGILFWNEREVGFGVELWFLYPTIKEINGIDGRRQVQGVQKVYIQYKTRHLLTSKFIYEAYLKLCPLTCKHFSTVNKYHKFVSRTQIKITMLPVSACCKLATTYRLLQHPAFWNWEGWRFEKLSLIFGEGSVRNLKSGGRNICVVSGSV